jgi:hypothetical protein
MLNIKNKSIVALSIAIIGFALVGCGSGSSSSSNKPPTSKVAAKPSPSPSNQSALQNQAGSILNGDWSCLGDSCKVQEDAEESDNLKSSNLQASGLQLSDLVISKDLTSFVQKGSKNVTQTDDDGENPQSYECNESMQNTLNISKIQDNGKVAVITAQILFGEASYDGQKGDGTPCYSLASDESNLDADDKELEEKKSKTVTITLDRTADTLTIAPVAGAAAVTTLENADGSTSHSSKKTSSTSAVQVYVKKSS